MLVQQGQRRVEITLFLPPLGNGALPERAFLCIGGGEAVAVAIEIDGD